MVPCFCLKPIPFSSPQQSPTTSPERNTQLKAALMDPSPKNKSDTRRKLMVQTLPHNKVCPKLPLLTLQLKNTASPVLKPQNTQITSGKQGHGLGTMLCAHRDARNSCYQRLLIGDQQPHPPRGGYGLAREPSSHCWLDQPCQLHHMETCSDLA